MGALGARFRGVSGRYGGPHAAGRTLPDPNPLITGTAGAGAAFMGVRIRLECGGPARRNPWRIRNFDPT